MVRFQMQGNYGAGEAVRVRFRREPCRALISMSARARGSPPDEDGLEFPDLDAAEREAAEATASIGRDLLPKGDAREVTIEVRNEHRQRVLTITVSMHLERVHPPPAPPTGSILPEASQVGVDASAKLLT